MLKAGSLTWYSCWRAWFKRPWPALELLEKEARSLNICFLPDFGVTLWPLPICWARLQLCLWLATSLTDPHPGCCLHVPPSLMSASSYMVLSDGLDSWRNLVTVTRPAWLVCCHALPLIDEAAASACFGGSGFTFHYGAAHFCCSTTCLLSSVKCEIFLWMPQKHNFHIELPRSVMSPQGRLQLRWDLHIYSFGLQLYPFLGRLLPFPNCLSPHHSSMQMKAISKSILHSCLLFRLSWSV